MAENKPKEEAPKNKYANGKIYKLCSNVDDKIYIGSTVGTLPKRLYDHKECLVRHPERNVYNHFNSIGAENIKIVLVESFPCANRAELCKRERHWYDELKPELNKAIPARTHQQYYQDIKDSPEQKKRNKINYAKNKEKINARAKKYREDNKEKVKEKASEKINCECGFTYSKTNRGRHLKSKHHTEWMENKDT
jgi:hypothetical protein